MFSGIDGYFIDNLEMEKLCDYFVEYLGVYWLVLVVLELLNCVVFVVMDVIKLVYERVFKVD